MIVQESDILVAALDRRLQVDRILTLAPLSPVADASLPPRGAAAAAAAAAPPTALQGQDVAATPGAFARLPLGQVVSARVVAVSSADQVIAQIGDLRVALSWPTGRSVLPLPGRNVALRVLAHRPMLLFQSLEADPLDDPIDEATDAHASTHWSGDALRLQTRGLSTDPSVTRGGPLRFDVPILEIAAALEDSRLGRIALDDVVVAGSTSLVDADAAPSTSRTIDDRTPVALPFMPLALEGPAWPGQPMELVVRRERDDDAFDNPVLDRWCGEVVIDLPRLGRVAGHLSFSMQGLRVRLESDHEAGVLALTSATAELAAAFADADLRLSGLTVGRPTADSMRPDPQAGPQHG